MAFVVLSNRTDFDRGRVSDGLLDIYLPGRVGPRPSAAEARAEDDLEPSGGWSPSAAELAAYQGVYRSSELHTEWRLRAEDGQLVAWHFRTGDHPLEPVAQDVFRGPPFGEVRFVRTGGGEVQAFTANSVRIRGLRFERVGGL